MPLALTDPRWNALHGSYGGTADIVAWLTEAYAQGGMSEERLGDLINEIQHQGDTSTAMYAVAPHLVVLARGAKPSDALEWLTHAGLIHAAADSPNAVACPEFLAADFAASAADGAPLLAPLLVTATNVDKWRFETFKYAVAALAGFMGHQSFARFLDGLDLYEGRFHHALLDEPFPPDV